MRCFAAPFHQVLPAVLLPLSLRWRGWFGCKILRGGRLDQLYLSDESAAQGTRLFLLALSYLQNFTRDLPGRFERAIFFHRSNKPVLLHLASSKLDQWESYHCIVYIFPPHCSNVLTTKPKLYTFWRIAHQEALSTSSFFASTEQPMYLGTGSKLVVKSKGLCFEAVASYKALYNQYGFHKQYLQ